MAKLDRLADVTITLRSTAITERSFSDMLIMGAHVMSPARWLVVTEADELLAMGISPTSRLYAAVRAARSQTPSVRQIFIGRAASASSTLTVDQAGAGVFNVQLQWFLNGAMQTAIATHTAAAGATTTATATALATAIRAVAHGATVTTATNVITIAPANAGSPVGIIPQAGGLTLGTPVANETASATLAAISASYDNWYGLVVVDRTPAYVEDAADWAEANEKLFTTTSDDINLVTPGASTGIGAVFARKDYARSVVRYSAAEAQYPEAAAMANRFTYVPGSETWANQQLTGVPYDNLSEGQWIAANINNVNTFEQFRNFSITQGGKVSGGEWIDVIRLRDQLVDSIKVAIVFAMINADGKLPYIEDGIVSIENAMRGPLDLNVRRGGIAPPELDETGRMIPSYTITMPLSSQISSNDKANRILRDIKFTARLAGAIHLVEVRGSLAYAL